MKKQDFISDFFGGLASMLVAFPSAVAFGLLVFAPLGPEYKSVGVMSGIMGAIVLGITVPATLGTPRLISAPCAPAAAILSAFVFQMSTQLTDSFTPATVVLLVTLLAILTGVFQLAFGMIGGGRLVKYIPFPVVTGYLSGVGVLIIFSQIPKLLGVTGDLPLMEVIQSPQMWNPHALTVGLVAMALMLLAGQITRAIPTPVIAVAGGVMAYFILAHFNPQLKVVQDNPLVIGYLTTGEHNFLKEFVSRWSQIASVNFHLISMIFMPALTLAVLLSIDTLKTCVIVDALTGSRHNSNNELKAQGIGNLATALLGGMSGAGTLGATLVNLSSGGHSSRSSIMEGVLSLLALLFFAGMIAWIPIAALAGILMVVGFRMIDKDSLRLVKQRSTALDFIVIVAVIVTAVSFNLMAAAGAGLALAILLFIRDQTRGSVVRRSYRGNQVFSKKYRLPDELAILEKEGSQIVVFELQGALFFGTTDQLFTEVEPYIGKCPYIIFNMRRVQSVDFTAAHMVEQIKHRINKAKGSLAITNFMATLPTGQNLGVYFDQVGLVQPQSGNVVFVDINEALEWAEERILNQRSGREREGEKLLEVDDILLFSSMPRQMMGCLAPHIRNISFRANDKIFHHGDQGDDIFIIRRGVVKIMLPLDGGSSHHLASFGRGDFFGDVAFLDRQKRSADAIAETDTDIFAISREDFEKACQEEPMIGSHVFLSLAHILAARLRRADAEIQDLKMS